MKLVDLVQANGNDLSRWNKTRETVTGIVEDLKDPAGLGRVKVNFPEFAEDKDAVALSRDRKETRSQLLGTNCHADGGQKTRDLVHPRGRGRSAGRA